jgi:hypothetical protein
MIINGYYSEYLADASASIDSVTDSGFLASIFRFSKEFRSTIRRTEQTLRAFCDTPCMDRNSVLIGRCHLMNEMSV